MTQPSYMLPRPSPPTVRPPLQPHTLLSNLTPSLTLPSGLVPVLPCFKESLKPSKGSSLVSPATPISLLLWQKNRLSFYARVCLRGYNK